MTTVESLSQTPKLSRLYARAALTSRGRHGDRLPERSYELNVSIDSARLAAYNQVCGFRQSDLLPSTYPHILAFPAHVLLMVSPGFPFALPGLVHINNRIEQRRPLRSSEALTVRVHAHNLRDHPRGRQFDMLTEVEVAGEPTWKESSTYLRRERRPSSSSPTPSQSEGKAAATPPTSIWRVPKDIGRRYAAVSGDVNPIHLNPVVARLFGFRRAIAHGMWLKARCVAALEGRLPDALVVDVEFKSPLLLPSTVAYHAERNGHGWSMSVAQVRTDRPHLRGAVHEL